MATKEQVAASKQNNHRFPTTLVFSVSPTKDKT
jgi:hypothetical protein